MKPKNIILLGIFIYFLIGLFFSLNQRQYQPMWSCPQYLGNEYKRQLVGNYKSSDKCVRNITLIEDISGTVLTAILWGPLFALKGAGMLTGVLN